METEFPLKSGSFTAFRAIWANLSYSSQECGTLGTAEVSSAPEFFCGAGSLRCQNCLSRNALGHFGLRSPSRIFFTTRTGKRTAAATATTRRTALVFCAGRQSHAPVSRRGSVQDLPKPRRKGAAFTTAVAGVPYCPVLRKCTGPGTYGF